MSHFEGHMYNERIKPVHIDIGLPNGQAPFELTTWEFEKDAIKSHISYDIRNLLFAPVKWVALAALLISALVSAA